MRRSWAEVVQERAGYGLLFWFGYVWWLGLDQGGDAVGGYGDYDGGD